MTVVRHQFSLRNLPVQACDSRAQGCSPPLARRRSSCPPPSPNLVRTHPIEHYQALRHSAFCLSRAATPPKGTKLGLGRGAHLGTPSSSANHTAAASQPTSCIAKAASWLHLSRVSPALHPPERPSHTHTPKPGFGGRGHDKASRIQSSRIGSALVCVRRNAQRRELNFPKFTRFALITTVMAAVPTGGSTGCLVSPPPLLSQIQQSHDESPESHRAQGETQTTSPALGANREGKKKVEGKASQIHSSRIGSELVLCARRNVQHRELKLPKSTRFVCVCVCVCVCVYLLNCT